MNRNFTAAALAVGLFVTGVGVASATSIQAAAPSWHTIPTLESPGVTFLKGKYTFEPAGAKHGAFHWKGRLQDRAPGDGNGVYMQVKVEGYGWRRHGGTQRAAVDKDVYSYDGAARYTHDAWIRACRDRGSLRPDNCSVTKHYTRH